MGVTVISGDWAAIIEESKEVDEQDSLTIQEFAVETGLTDVTAGRRLKKMEAAGTLVKCRKHNGRRLVDAWKPAK